jgi:cytochrome bd ubiquinol oxidase subunit I
VQVIVGDWAGREVADMQPVKLAAFEGLGRTTEGAPFHVGGIYDDGEVKGAVEVPRLLSLLAEHDPNARITGLDAVAEADRPPVNVVRFAFQAMVGIGTLLALLGAVVVATWFRHGRLPRGRWVPPAVMAAGPLALVALLAGWVTTEVGRQPWIVYGVMRTEDAVTNAGGVGVTFALVLALYAVLGAALVVTLRAMSRRWRAEGEREADVPYGPDAEVPR